MDSHPITPLKRRKEDVPLKEDLTKRRKVSDAEAADSEADAWIIADTEDEDDTDS